ncbi:G2/mitotic-specific cyclin-B2-like [Lineus longissimus]|uniref:G2/mitotic-specific cyclin-B2-like n=1 Tax=Lineus longissimus TaxID=88925 RepID=UPI00315D9BF7
MPTSVEKGSTLAKWRKRVAANVKGKKRSINNVEEENLGGKERRTMGIVVEQRQAFRTIDNKVSDIAGIGRKGAVRSSKTCTEQEGRKVGIVPPQAAVRSEPMAGEAFIDKDQRGYAKEVSFGDIPAKRSKRGKGPPFNIPVPRPMITADQSLNLHTLGWAIDTLMKPPENVIDIDHGDTELFMHAEYHSDIIQYLRDKEAKYAHDNIDFLQLGEVSTHMRTILVDWLIQVQLHLVLMDETLHLSVTLMDRFLSRKHIQLSKFQLLGVSCMFVAAKFTERFAPEIETLVHLTDNTYNYQQVLDMEIIILNALKFDLSFADPYQFLERFIKATRKKDDIVRYMSMYFLDLSLIDSQCIIYKPSMLAAAALCLVRQIINDMSEAPWTATLVYYSEYRMLELVPCMKRLARSHLKLGQTKYTAAQDKYSNKGYLGVSKLPVLLSNLALTRLASDEN